MRETASPTADALVAVAELCSRRLIDVEDFDWAIGVEGLYWSCRETLEHLASLA